VRATNDAAYQQHVAELYEGCLFKSVAVLNNTLATSALYKFSLDKSPFDQNIIGMINCPGMMSYSPAGVMRSMIYHTINNGRYFHNQMVFDYTLSMIANKRHLVDVNGDLIGMHDIAHIIRDDHVQNGQLVYDPLEDD
jgi:hypothetical protein